MIEAVIGLTGVALGFGLGAGYDVFKEWRNRKLYRSAIAAELKSNLHSIPQKLNTIRNMLSALERGELLPGPAVRFSRSSYAQYYPSVAAHLSDLERNSLHLLYEYFRVADHLLDTFASDIAQALGTEQVNARVDLAKAMLGDLPNLLTDTESLLQEHISGSPRDVYLIGEAYSDVKQLQFTRDRRHT